jgi:glycosyltransferase involved in cell wall biosynthesis
MPSDNTTTPNMPLTFSVITCTWNSAAWLEASIQSVLTQDHPSIEYIFVDGGSTDGTLERIHRLGRPYTLLENVGGGISRAMNAGIEAATGDVIAHLHSDDYYLRPDVLSQVAGKLEGSRCGWLFGRTVRDVDGKRIPENYVAPRYSAKRLLRGNFIPHPATFVRRELMQRCGGFNPKFKYAMDYDLWLRLSQLSDPIQLDIALAAFREHAGSLSTSNRLAAMEEDFRVRLAHAEQRPFARLERLEHSARYFVRRRRAAQAGAER